MESENRPLKREFQSTLKGKRLATEKFLNQLTMLSRLRNLQEKTITILENMTDIEFDLDNDILYQRGLETGVEQGLEQGMEKGAIKKSIAGIRNMTASNLDVESIAQFLNVKVAFVKKIQKQLPLVPQLIIALKKDKLVTEAIVKKMKIHPLLVEVIRDDLLQKKKK